MGRDAQVATLADKIGGIETLVAADRREPGSRNFLQHHQGASPAASQTLPTISPWRWSTSRFPR